MHAVADPSELPLAFAVVTASQNCLIVFTSSSLLDGLVALNSKVSNVAAWAKFDVGESLFGEVGDRPPTNFFTKRVSYLVVALINCLE